MEVYLITGATSGLGKAIYEKLSENSSCLLIARNEEKLRELVAGKNNQFYTACDLGNGIEINKVFNFCEENSFKIRGIIHCAGVSPICNFGDIDISDCLNTFQLNSISFIKVCKELFAYKQKCDDTRVIAITSIAAERASARQTVYAASKAALNSAIASAAQEGIKSGVRVNGISLGACDTPMLTNMNTSIDFKEKINRHYPLGIIDPVELALIVEDFLSDKYHYMTGSIIKIDSGFSVVH